MMKGLLSIISVLLLFSAIACEKTNDNLCINRIYDSPDAKILSQEKLNAIKSLFQKNQLDLNHYQFYWFEKDELGHHHAGCYQFVNNLKVFTNDLIFHFDQNDNYYFLSGDKVNGIDLDNAPVMSASSIIRIFREERSKDEFRILSNDSCCDIELGYYDLNAGISYAEENFTRAWKVKPENKEYPFVFINDLTSQVIYYDNGIRY